MNYVAAWEAKHMINVARAIRATAVIDGVAAPNSRQAIVPAHYKTFATNHCGRLVASRFCTR